MDSTASNVEDVVTVAAAGITILAVSVKISLLVGCIAVEYDLTGTLAVVFTTCTDLVVAKVEITAVVAAAGITK